MTPFLETACALLLLMGSFLVFLAALGLLKLPDLFMRTAAVTKAVTLGLGFCQLGFLVYFPIWGHSLKIIGMIFFFFLTSSTASHLIARAGYRSGAKLFRGTHLDEWKGKS